MTENGKLKTGNGNVKKMEEKQNKNTKKTKMKIKQEPISNIEKKRYLTNQKGKGQIANHWYSEVEIEIREVEKKTMYNNIIKNEKMCT